MTTHLRSSHPHYDPLHHPKFLFYVASPSPSPSPAPVNVAHRRFLKARGYNASQAKQMILECIQWRRTVEDVGIEELYRSIDPFDVRSAPSLSLSLGLFSLRLSKRIYLTSVVLFLPHSFPDGSVYLRAGQWVSIRYAHHLTSPPSRNAYTQNQCSASDPSLPFRLTR